MKISSSILACLINGRPHAVRDLIPYLRRRINPTAMIRAYKRDRGRNTKTVRSEPPFAKQMELGMYSILNSSIHNLEEYGSITVVRPNGYYEGRMLDHTTIQLTPLGHKVLWSPQTYGQKQVGSQAWTELFHAKNNGWLGVEIEVTVLVNGDEEPPLSVSENGRVESEVA